METVRVVFDGIPLIVPVIAGQPMEFPYDTHQAFPAYCGAGQGIGNALVPETIERVRVSVACYIHDVMFAVADKTWTEFHNCNYIFFLNLLSVIQKKAKTLEQRYKALKYIYLYFLAVDKLSQIFFFKEGDLDEQRQDLDRCESSVDVTYISRN